MSVFEIVISILTAIYVGATILYVRVSRSMLHAIRDQGISSTKQFTEQIAEAKKSADAARDGAEAAKASADALMHSERAWLLVDAEPAPGYATFQIGTANGVPYASICVVVVVRNQGRSPAWVTQQFIRFENLDAIPSTPTPNFDKDLADGDVYVEAIAVGGETRRESDRLVARGDFENAPESILYGIVRYHDIFGRDRYTTFGYFVRSKGGLERMIDFPDYNKNT